MGIVVKQAIKGTFYTYLGVLIGFLTVGIILPKFFSAEQNGLLKIIVSYATLLGQFGTLGFTSATTRLFPFFRNPNKGHHGFLFISFIVLITGFAFSFLVFCFLKPHILNETQTEYVNLNQFIWLIIVLTFFTITFQLSDAYLRANYIAVPGTFVKEFLQRLLILISLIFYVFDLIHFNVFVFIYIGIFCLSGIFLLIILILKKNFFLKPNFSFINRPLFKDLISVSFFGIISSFSDVIILNVDNIMISALDSLKSAGIYSITFYFASMILIPSRALSRISSSVVAESWKKNDLNTIKTTYVKSCITQYVIGFGIYILLLCNLHNIFLFLPPVYAPGINVICLIGFANVINMATGINTALIGTSKHYKFQTYVMLLLAILLICTNYIFIPKWGITGAAAATMFSVILFNLIKYLFILFKFKMQPFNKTYIYVTLIGFGIFAISFLSPKFNNYILDGIFRSAIVIIIYISGIYFLKASEEINKIISFFFKLKSKHHDSL